MENFEYAHPAKLKDAVGMLGVNWSDAAVLAGGTDLLSLMKDYVEKPKRVVNVKGIGELEGIHTGKQGITIGALVSVEELRTNSSIAKDFPSLVQAAAGIASAQIRTMGTVAGDLCQRPRCWYFRNGFGLLAQDADGKSLVPGGENKYHAILGNDGPAYFVSPSSLAPALIALGASATITGPGGSREIPLANFFLIPGSASEREHALKPNEILTRITIPAASQGLSNATYEVRQRQILDWPLATASVAFRLDGSTIRSARIVLGHVAPIPWSATAAETLIAGHSLSEDLSEQVGEAAVLGARPLSQNKYKVQLARVAVKRALLAARNPGA
ncbi:MAG: xanthine dehydrogenase family protein subunit M [Acidobacteriia bacterium]|nr:xanthine dehydrogenase family protein subunit M [Terriglobia bacterium]